MKRTFFLMALIAIVSKVFSQDINISAVAPSGQTLFYRLLNNTAYVVSPEDMTDSNYVSGDLIIPDTVFYNGDAYPVVQIWDFAFWGCRDLTSVVISNGVFRIHNNAFLSCTNMRSVSMPNSVLIIESAAFADCLSLDSVVIPNQVTTIEDGTFSHCHSLSSITIPPSVTVIKKHAFSDCHALRTIDFPNTLTEIGKWAFFRCDSLTTVTIPEMVTAIGQSAFTDCPNLRTIWLKPAIPPMDTISYHFPVHSTLIVPHDSYDDYIAWKGTKRYNIYCDTVYLTTLGAKKNWGYVMGADTLYAYPYDTIRLEAVAYPGYEFSGWEDGLTDPVRYLVGIQHDTILYASFTEVQAGITDILGDGIQVSAHDGHISVYGAQEEVAIYDITGRQIAHVKGTSLDIRIPHPGVYLLKIGSRPAHKTVVIK